MTQNQNKASSENLVKPKFLNKKKNQFYSKGHCPFFFSDSIIKERKKRGIYNMAINIFLGAPGTGKGTISNELKAKGFKHFSTGDMFRYNMKNETPLGLQVKAIIDAGNLVEDELTFEMLKDALMRDADLTNDSIILDGYPRTINQANLLND